MTWPRLDRPMAIFGGPACNLDDFRQQARRRLPKPVFDYVEGAAGDEVSMVANRAAFADISLWPRVGRDVSDRDLSVTLLGQTLDFPVLLAPAGQAGSVYPLGEIAAARAAELCGTRAIISTGSSYRLEEISDATTRSHWFQLYAWRDREFVDKLLRRVHAAGYSTVCLTLDLPVSGSRERDKKNGFTLPPRLTAPNLVAAARHPVWTARALANPRFTMANLVDDSLTEESGDEDALSPIDRNRKLINPTFDWDDVARLRERWDGTFAVKGVMTAEDAEIAVRLGADAIVVSNHGGRQLDGAAATIHALPAVAAAVGDTAHVLLDGGVRRGTDVVKALALGADACLIGRPWLYGLAVDGQSGVRKVLDLLRDEIDTCIALLGLRKIGDIGPSVVGHQQPASERAAEVI